MTIAIKGITLCTLLDNYPDKVKAHILKCSDNGLLQQPISSHIRLTAGVWNTFQHSCNKTVWRLMGGDWQSEGQASSLPTSSQGLGEWHIRLHFLCSPNRIHTPRVCYFLNHMRPGHWTGSFCIQGFQLMGFEDKMSPVVLRAHPWDSCYLHEPCRDTIAKPCRKGYFIVLMKSSFHLYFIFKPEFSKQYCND